MATDWTAPTAAMVAQEFTAKEIALITSHQGTDFTAAILLRVTAEIAGAIIAGGYASRAEVAAAPTLLPPDLHEDAIAITRWRLLLACPQLENMQTKAREGAYNDAREKLKLIASQEWQIRPFTIASEEFSNGTWNSENKVIGTMHPVPVPSVQWPAADTDYANADAPADRTA